MRLSRSLLLGVVASSLFASGVAHSYDGIENPRQLACGVMQTPLAKAVPKKDGKLTGSATDVFVKSIFPVALSEKDALQRTADLNLACKRRGMKAVERLSCKTEPSFCRIFDSLTLKVTLEPAVMVYLDAGKVVDANIEWAFASGPWFP